MDEKSEARLAMEKEASELGIKGNIAGFKDETLAKKIAEAKEPAPKVDKADLVNIGKNACGGKFGIAGKEFGPGEDIILTKSELKIRNVDARITHAKKIGMIS